ncbi:DUF2303 family protein, partial [Pseudomonas graminis]|uniref:DUF2303 family protein n=1 Tax=Pseudomonas graminis TaxID=158627 RepID=UPI003C13BC63
KYQAGRSRFRGTYTNHALADFSTYVADRAAAGARGFINQEEMSCVLLFNLGTASEPGRADDRAVLKLKATAGFTAAQQVSAN